MTDGVTVVRKMFLAIRRRGRQEIQPGPAPAEPRALTGNVPRVSRLMALAIRFDDLIRSGKVADQAELARLGHVTRARLTQIMNMLLLAPDIQEAVLHLSPTLNGHDPIRESNLRPVVALVSWSDQRKAWKSLIADFAACSLPKS